MSSTNKHTFGNLAAKLFNKEPTENKGHVDNTNSMGMHAEDKTTTVHKETSLPMEKAAVVEKTTVVTPAVQAGAPIITPAVQAGAPIVHSRTFAPIVETHVNPTVLDQTVRKETVVEIQPIVHRMVEEREVHVIEKHVYETVPSTGPTTITKQAIVEETIKPRIIEEIQPVLHREVPVPYITHVEQHISEHEVLPTVHTKEVITEKKEWTAEEALKKGFVAPVVPVVAKAPVVHSHREAAIVDTHVNATVVQQTTRPERVTEIQPIIHREIDAPEVHLIEKHMHETVPMTGPRTITKQAIVEEEIHPKIIEEIMPVIHREVPEMVIEKVEEHITEKVVAPTIQSKEVISENRVGAPIALVPNMAPVPTTPIVHSATAKASLTSNTHNLVVEETARPEEVIEVQPIIHRDVDAPEVHVIEKHMYETVPTVGPTKITKDIIVEETVVPKIREEIVPVVHREVPVAVIEHVEEHVSENVTLKTTETKQVFVDGKKVMGDEKRESATHKNEL